MVSTYRCKKTLFLSRVDLNGGGGGGGGESGIKLQLEALQGRLGRH